MRVENLVEVYAMNLVFSFDEGYSKTFQVLMHSIFMNNPHTKMNVYLLHESMPKTVLEELDEQIKGYGYSFEALDCREFLEQSEDFRINRYYTVEMYLWL